MVMRALEGAGYTIDSAADGQAGLELALAGDYQLVILDLVMPQADGRQVIMAAAARAAGRSRCWCCPACPT